MSSNMNQDFVVNKLLEMGFTHIKILQQGEIGRIGDALVDEEGVNIHSSQGSARICHDFIFHKFFKLKKWCDYWLKQGREPIATIRANNSYPKEWDGYMSTAIIGIGLK